MIFKMSLSIFLLFAAVFVCLRAEENTFNRTEQMSLLGDAYKTTGLLFELCWRKAVRYDKDNISFGFQQCLKRRTLIALERLLDKNVIQLPYNMQLIRIKRNNASEIRFIRRNARLFIENWKEEVIDRISAFFQTHALRIPLPTNDNFEGRRRHHRGGHMMPLMLFGVMAMAIIAIPLGFQFLAVLGGKALLLAKLALILTSIQGLKKIATSDFNYGFYQTAHHDVKPWLYDRRWHPTGHHVHNYDGGYDATDQQLDLYHLKPRISED